MDNLDTQLRRLSKIEPSKRFISESKNRLMQQIKMHQQESWFKTFLRKLGRVQVPPEFRQMARLRLMHRITRQPQSLRVPVGGMARFLYYTKRAVASTLVMLIAVTSTLFFVEGNTVVEASDDSFLEVVTGQASVKHPDFIVWENVNRLIEVQDGDIIKVADDSEAIIHFFDDTEVRIGENSELLISRLAVSPAFGRQGIIELSLHKGTAWVQTLNVDDGHAGFVLRTRDAVAKTLNSTFYLTTDIGQPTSVFVFDDKVELTSLTAESRQPVEKIRLSADEKATVYESGGQPVLSMASLDQQDRSNVWVQNNLSRDRQHLVALRERGIDRLQQMAGTLPGHMLYPVKQAKERLRLAFSNDSDLDLKIEIANRRLNEALVLFEAGEQERAQTSLSAYQEMARRIVEEGSSQNEEVVSKLIVPHQKALTAELPVDSGTGMVKEALHETAEILINDPVELEKARLAGSVQRLQDVVTLLGEGDKEAARQRLESHQPVSGNALEAAQAIEDEVIKKAVLQETLELHQEEMALLNKLSELLANEKNEEELTAMVDSASQTVEENLEATLFAALPLLPEIEEITAQPSAADIRMAELIDKVYLYQSWTGQQNQIERLLKNDLENPASIAYLTTVRDHLEGRARDYLNVRILQLQKKADFQKHKAMQRKIERAKRLREES